MATRTTGIGEMPMQYPAVEQWFKRLSFYLKASKSEELGKEVLLSSCGEAAFSLIETILAPQLLEEVEVSLKIIEEAVQNHFRPKLILHVERHKLHAMIQKSGESASVFIQRLKDQANKCAFKDMKDDLILTQFIFGILDHKTRDKLLTMDDLKLDKAIQQVLLQESISSAVSIEANISAVVTATSSALPSFSGVCYSCGNHHRRKECKFRNANCNKCGRVGHIARVCRSSTADSMHKKNYSNTRQLNEENVDHSNTDDVVLSLKDESINSINLSMKPKLWHEDCVVGGASVRFLVDTGSEVTTIPKKLAIATGYQVSKSGFCGLRAFGGSKPLIFGKMEDVQIKLGGESAVGTVLISEDHEQALLGMNFIHGLNLLNGRCCPVTLTEDANFVASFRLKENISLDGMKFAARSLPFSMKSMVETELRRMLDSGIIYPVENPCVSAPIVPVRKQEGALKPIRICGDYSCTLNRVIDPDAYRIPKIEEILEKIPNCRYYSVLDLEDAYLQINLSKESQPLTCISTHLGHFAFRKMQFGISAAPLIFQEVMDKVLKGIPSVAAYQDDIIVGGKTKEEHDCILAMVLRRLSEHSFKVNNNKSQIGLLAVNFLGFRITAGKLLPRPDRLAEFEKIPVPQSKEELQSVLSTLRHYGQFCKNFSMIAQPLYALLKKKSVGPGLQFMRGLWKSCFRIFRRDASLVMT